MTIDQFFYLLLGASLAGIVTLGVWLLKDRLMVFGNVLFWGSGFDGYYDLPRAENDGWPGHICYQHVVLQVRAMGDRVLGTRIQFPADDKETQVDIRPSVPFDFGKNRPGEMHIPHMQSGKYVIRYACKSNMRLSSSASSVFSDNARTIGRYVSPAPMDERERKLLFNGLYLLGAIAMFALGSIINVA